MVTTINEYAQRPKRTLESDGIHDMLFGLCCLCMALILYTGSLESAALHSAVKQGGHFWENHAYRASHLYFMGAVFAANAVIILSVRGMMFLRKRFVTPRLGYVGLPSVPLARRMTRALVVGVTGFSVTMVMIWVIYRYNDPFRHLHFWTGEMTVIAIGFLVGCALVMQYAKMGFARHLVLSGISLLAAILVASLHPGWELGSALLLTIVGVCLIISGAVPFVKILRMPPATDQDTE